MSVTQKMQPQASRGRSALISMLPFYISVGLFLASFIGSLFTRAYGSYFGFVDVTAFLIGLAILFITAPLVLTAASGPSNRFRIGVFCAGAGSALLALWPFVLVLLVFPTGESAHVACRDTLGGSGGRIIAITQSLFPTQIHCDTTQGTDMAAVYSGWESAGLSSVTLLLVAVVAVGVWLMATRGRRET